MKLCIVVILALFISTVTIVLVNLIRLKQKIKEYLNQINTYTRQKKELVLEILNCKASSNILRLQHELKEIETKLSSLDKLYNDNVIIYNTKISRFPINIIANFFGFKKIC